MRSSKGLRNLTVIVFLFLLINFVRLTDISSVDEKPMIVVKEYYYYSFGDVELRYPYSLSDEELKEFEFEKTGVHNTLYKFIGKNDTGYDICIGDIHIDKSMKTVDLTVITTREYRNPENINFDEVVKILHDEKLIDKKRIILENFYGEILIQMHQKKERGHTVGIYIGGYTIGSYKLPLIYCMIENCNIGTSEDKRILDVSNFKDEKNITEGPYSAQNEKGQIIVWRSPAEYKHRINDYLYILNAYERGEYGGGFEIDKTFMRETIDTLANIFSKRYCDRDIEKFEERSNYFIEKIEFITKDALTKWSVIPFLWARYKGYMYMYDTRKDYFSVTSGIFPEKTKIEFEYSFVQEFGTEENNVKNLIESHILYIFDEVEKNHERYKKRIIDRYDSQMEDFDNIYLTIAAIYGIVFGFITLFCKIFWNKIKNFWIKSTNKKRRVLYIIISTVVIFIITYIIGHDAIVIQKINQTKVVYPYHLMTNTEKSWVLLFSLVVAGLWALWSFREQINLRSKKIIHRRNK